MSKKRNYAYLLILVPYILILWALPANVFEFLFLAPIVCSAWAITMIIMLIKSWKTLWASIKSGSGDGQWKTDSEYIAEWEVEPKDSLWVVHTISLTGFSLYYIIVLVSDIIARGG